MIILGDLFPICCEKCLICNVRILHDNFGIFVSYLL